MTFLFVIDRQLLEIMTDAWTQCINSYGILFQVYFKRLPVATSNCNLNDKCILLIKYGIRVPAYFKRIDAIMISDYKIKKVSFIYWP